MKLTERFWLWYERHYALNLTLTAGLFILQLVHLYWLFGGVITVRLFELNLFPIGKTAELIVMLVDYTEVPAIIATSLVYINELRKRFNLKSLALLLMLNSQWLHLLWITDEFVFMAFSQNSPIPFPIWLAWIAILIDYLEVPVILDILKKSGAAIRERKFKRLGAILKEEN